MIHKKEAVNYAKALFKISGTPEQIQQRQADLELIGTLVKKEPKVFKMLSCPELSTETRMETLENGFKVVLDPLVKNLLSLVLQRGKMKILHQIAIEYHKLVIHHLQGIDVEVASASPLSEKVKKILREKLESLLKKKIDLIETIEPALLGGFTLLIHNQMLDLSVKGKIVNLKKQLLKGEV